MNKILVTGGLGYIGSHVVVELQKMDFEVIIIDDLSNSSLEVLGRIEEVTGVKPGFEKIDLKEKHNVNRFFNCHADIDGIIHFAASKAVGESVKNQLVLLQVVSRHCQTLLLCQQMKWSKILDKDFY